uniref:Retrotransposon protein, putative, Ty1-copia subclass n=1 Tax=Tanacetum cinerariifolium TaxID=118510 RepID=A0A699H429_TANCI|nr:hypothetical protein [Tanacetum cinerariifolium]
MCLYIDAEEHEFGDLGKPANYKAALLDPESEKWLNVMNVEMQSMKDNKVLVELPPNGKTISSKWLFKKKTDMDRVVHTYKARLVAKGYTQTPGIDYEETFSLVADVRAIRILIAIATYYDYEICVKSYIDRCFAMKDLGEAAYILGIKIYRDGSRRLTRLCQSAYIKKILKRYCMENSKRGSIPMQEKLKLSKSQGASTPVEWKRMQNVPYASAVGDLHWTIVKNILKYLRNTKYMFLVYGGGLKGELRVSCYTDVGYLTDVDDLKSQTGYVFVLNGGAIDWMSAKQSIFATSYAEAEYIAAFDASNKDVWVRKFISGLGVVPTVEEPKKDGGADLTVEQVRKRAKWDNDDYVCRGLILNGMSNSLFDIYQNVDTFKEPWDTLEAKYMAEGASSKKFLEEGQSVSSYILKMKSYIDNLERLGQPVSQNLAVSLILVSLNKDYDNFVQNYNMHGMGKTVNKLHAMLKLHEDTLPNKDATPVLHTPPPPKKDNPAKDAICHQCGEIGHWRRNCLVYLAELMKKKKLSQEASTSSDGHRAAIEAIRTYHLELPSGLVIVLNNCHYAPSFTRAIKEPKLIWTLLSCGTLVLDTLARNALKGCNMMGFYNSMDIESLGKYVSCMSGKMARKPYSHQVERAKYLFGLVHTDVCGPFRIVSRLRANYFVTFIDDFSQNQLGKTIRSLQSDRGGEYMSQEFLDYLKEHRIIVHRTPPYMPQHNGVLERRNRTLLDMVRSMMSQTTLPKSFWDYALETAARILNIVLTKKRDTLTKPDKLDPRSFRCIFVGYPTETMGFSFYSPSENKLFVAQNAEFFENDLIDLKASGSVEDLELIQEEDSNPSLDTSLDHEEDDQEIDEPQSDINPIQKSFRIRRASNRMCLYIDAEEHELGDLSEPANYKVALLDMESKKWLDAMNVEIRSMKDNDVWVLVELPPNARTVGSKWLFKKKTDMDDIRAIRILIAIAAYYDYEIWHMDVKTVFLNGHLSKEVYMEKLKGFVNPNVLTITKQSIFATSSTDVEYIAAFDASNEAIWIRKFIYGLGIVSTIEEPISMYCDNTGAITIVKDDGVTKGARHFCVKVYYLRETIKLGDVKIEKVDTYDNLADPFTKSLSFPKHSELTRNIRMFPASSFM